MVTHNSKSDLPLSWICFFWQMYIGLVIGILGVTVVLLIVTIVVMMRRNKQKIFNKNSMMFKSPLSDRHMMRDISNHGPSTVTSKLYDESEHEESTSIYHEPYRLVLQRGMSMFFRQITRT